jgi:hypothetical protein
MSGLAALLAGHTPPGVYRWHSVASVTDVQHAVELAGWTFCQLDGWAIEDPETFLKATAAALELPAPVPGLEGLADHLVDRDMGDQGTVLLWDGWSPLARRDQAVFERALGAFERRAGSDGGRFAVLLRGEGPGIDLAELPIKH